MSKRTATTPSLPFDEPAGAAPPLADAVDRAASVDPRLNVVLEASAGTGKTRVLVDRYTNLVRAGVEPRNILAITFTRKAAAEMRDRILSNLRRAADEGSLDAARWRALRDHLPDVAISTIDAFCLSLLREFPLEADLDPGFSMADETEALRLVDEAADRTMRICRAAALQDPSVALVLARLGDWQLRVGLRSLIDRRLVAADVLARAMRPIPESLTPVGTAQLLIERLRATLGGTGVDAFIRSGPLHHPKFRLLAADLRRLVHSVPPDDEPAFRTARLLVDGLRDYFLTREGLPRKRVAYAKGDFPDERARRAHLELATSLAPRIADDIAAFRRDVNAVLTRGVWHIFAIARKEYRRTLDQHAVVDFPEALARALDLLGAMGEFTESRFVLESRYHHLLVDEFQDTSDAQWRLVWQLVKSWREGRGVADDLPLEPTIFVVGDRKQSIYGFRDADVGVLMRAAGYVAELRGGDEKVRRAIRRSFRAVPQLLAFTNALFEAVDKAQDRADAFTYEDRDRFPVENDEDSGEPVLGIVAAQDGAGSARAVAAEIARLLESGTVRDRESGIGRAARPGDFGILFRTREGHQEFERALEARGIRSYVYKGLGFFDADEIKDVIALLRYLADPSSDLRAAALLRSRFVRLSDRALTILAPHLARALVEEPAAAAALDEDDRAVLARTRDTVPRWVALADRVPPAELLDRALSESAYFWELTGTRADQARENLKKIRGFVRRIQNRGYTTLARLTDHLDRLSAGDESNAAIDAVDAVNLMTVHAAKGLEFPVVFVVNLSKGAGGSRAPIRFSAPAAQNPVVSVGDFRSEADEDTSAREREEAKRLLYVAVTRARDRLYLATTLADGVFKPGRLGLGDVLPGDLRVLFSQALATQGMLLWVTPSGSHRFNVCPVPDEDARAPSLDDAVKPASLQDFTRLDPGGHRTDSRVTDVAFPELWAVPASNELGHGTDPVPSWTVPNLRGTWGQSPISEVRSNARIVGSLVHRLLDRQALGMTREELAELTLGLVRRDERLESMDLPSVVDQAVSRYQALIARPDLSALFSAGNTWHEVPVTLDASGRRIRGSIDTLIVIPGDNPSGLPARVVVVEFKTGRPGASHRAQLDQYVAAAKALFPNVEVEGLLVYTGDSDEEPSG